MSESSEMLEAAAAKYVEVFAATGKRKKAREAWRLIMELEEDGEVLISPEVRKKARAARLKVVEEAAEEARDQLRCAIPKATEVLARFLSKDVIASRPAEALKAAIYLLDKQLKAEEGGVEPRKENLRERLDRGLRIVERVS